MDNIYGVYNRRRQTKGASGFKHGLKRDEHLYWELLVKVLRNINHSFFVSEERNAMGRGGRVEEVLKNAYAISSEFEKIMRSYKESSTKYLHGSLFATSDYKNSSGQDRRETSRRPRNQEDYYQAFSFESSSPAPEDESYFNLPSIEEVFEAGSDLIDSGSSALRTASQTVSEGASNASDSFTRNRIGNLDGEQYLYCELQKIAERGHSSIDRKLQQTNEFLETFLRSYLRTNIPSEAGLTYDQLFLASLVASNNCMRVQHKIVVDTIGELNKAIDEFNSKQLVGRGRNSDELVDNLVEFANTLELHISDMEKRLLDVAPEVADGIDNGLPYFTPEELMSYGNNPGGRLEQFSKTELQYWKNLELLISDLQDEVDGIREGAFSKTIFGGIESLSSSLVGGDDERTATQEYNSEFTDRAYQQQPRVVKTPGRLKNETVYTIYEDDIHGEKSRLESLRDSITALPASAKEWNDERIEENDHAIQSLKLAEQLQAIFKVQQLLLRWAEQMDVSVDKNQDLPFSLNPTAENLYGQLFFNQHVSDTISGKRSHGRLVDGGVAAGGAAVVAAGGGLIVSGFLSGGMIPLGVGAVAGITSLAALAKAAFTHNQVSLEEFLQASSSDLTEISREELNLQYLLTFTYENFYQEDDVYNGLRDIMQDLSYSSIGAEELLKKIEAILLVTTSEEAWFLDPKLESRRQELIEERDYELKEYHDFTEFFEKVERNEELHPAKKVLATGFLSTVAGVHGIYKSVSEGIDSFKDSVRGEVNGRSLDTEDLYYAQLNALKNIPLLIQKYGVTELPNILTGQSIYEEEILQLQIGPFDTAFYNVDKVFGQSDVQSFVEEISEHYKSNVAGPAEVLAAHAFAAYRPGETFHLPQRQSESNETVATEDKRGEAPQPSAYQGGYGKI